MADPIRIVIVDDDPDIRSLLRTTLDDPEFEIVGEASDGTEAVAVVRQTHPQAVILDLMMPRVDGLAAMEQIKHALPDVFVIVLTAGGRAMMAEALGRGADAYVEKLESQDLLPKLLMSLVGKQPGENEEP